MASFRWADTMASARKYEFAEKFFENFFKKRIRANFVNFVAIVLMLIKQIINSQVYI